MIHENNIHALKWAGIGGGILLAISLLAGAGLGGVLGLFLFFTMFTGLYQTQ